MNDRRCRAQGLPFALAGFVILSALAMPACAAALDGEWQGRMECSALMPRISAPASATPAYGQPVTVALRAAKVRGAFDGEVSHEEISGTFDGSEMRLSFDGHRKNRPAWWQINLTGPVQDGNADLSGTMVGRNGEILRTCTLKLASVEFERARREARSAAMRAEQERIATAVAAAAAQERAATDRAAAEDAAARRLAAEAAEAAAAKRIADDAVAPTRTAPAGEARRLNIHRSAAASVSVSASAAPVMPDRADAVAREKVVRERAEAERSAAEKANVAKAAAKKDASDQLAQEKVDAEKARADKATADKAEQDKNKPAVKAKSTMDL